MAADSATAGWVISAEFDLSRPQPVARYLDHIIHPADDPEISVLVSLGRISGRIAARIFAPVLAHVAFIITEDRSQHCRPGMFQCKITFCVIRYRISVLIQDLGLLAEERPRP